MIMIDKENKVTLNIYWALTKCQAWCQTFQRSLLLVPTLKCIGQKWNFHFIDAKTEAQERQVSCPGAHGYLVEYSCFKPRTCTLTHYRASLSLSKDCSRVGTLTCTLGLNENKPHHSKNPVHAPGLAEPRTARLQPNAPTVPHHKDVVS